VIDVDIVVRKLTSLTDHLERLRRRRPNDVAAFVADLDRQDAVAMSLLVAIQDAVDIALHIASDEGWGVAASYAESFELLYVHAVIDAELARLLSGVASLRNRLAHGYATVDAARLWSELPAGTDALHRFAIAIAVHLSPPAR
jgi:uncharacterized protein YutE (UPF0331/DUF86 family)